MVYSLPRKSRGEWPDVSTSFRSPARSSTERARELQDILEASGYTPGTPRRPQAPLASTPLQRRSLRPYGDFPMPNWSTNDSKEPHPVHSRLQTAPRSPFAPRRRPPPDVHSSPQLVLRAPSPASSTDDPLLLDESGTPDLTMQAAHGDSRLVSMVRGLEREDLGTRSTPDLYDRSIGVRERISLIMSPTKSTKVDDESNTLSARDVTQERDDTPHVHGDAPEHDPTMAHDTPRAHGIPDMPQHASMSHAPATPPARTPPDKVSSRRPTRRSAQSSQPRYIDFLEDADRDDQDHDNWMRELGSSPDGKLKFVWGGTPGASITRTRQRAKARTLEVTESVARDKEAREAEAREAEEAAWAAEDAAAQEAEEAAEREEAAREEEARVEAAREAAAREAREEAAREAAAREEAVREAAAREEAAREAAAREEAAREAAAREKAAREATAREASAREIAAREEAVREAAARRVKEEAEAQERAVQERAQARKMKEQQAIDRTALEDTARSTPPRSTPPISRGTPGKSQRITTPRSAFGVLKEEPATPLSSKLARVQHAGVTPRFSRTRSTPRHTPRLFDDERDEFVPDWSVQQSPRTDEPVLPSDGTLLDEWSMNASRLRDEQTSRLSGLENLGENEMESKSESELDELASPSSERAHASNSRTPGSDEMTNNYSHEPEPHNISNSWMHSHSTPHRSGAPTARISPKRAARLPTTIKLPEDRHESPKVTRSGPSDSMHITDTQSNYTPSDVLDTSMDLPEPPQVTPLDHFELPHAQNITGLSHLSPVPEVSEEISRSLGSRTIGASNSTRRVQRPFVRDASEEAKLHTTPGRKSLIADERPKARRIQTRIPVPVRQEAVSAGEEQSTVRTDSPSRWPASPFFQRFQRLPGEQAPHFAGTGTDKQKNVTQMGTQPVGEHLLHSQMAQPDIMHKDTQMPPPTNDTSHTSPGAPRLSQVRSAVSPVKRKVGDTRNTPPSAGARPFASSRFANELATRNRKTPVSTVDHSAERISAADARAPTAIVDTEASASVSLEALSDLSASLSASSHERALMLTRTRPTACVEVSSVDPRAAARAAAILKVHHQYIEEGWLAPDSEPSTFPGLLIDAEQSLRDTAPMTPATRQPGTPWLPGAFTPRSVHRARSGAPRITAHALRPQAQAGRWSQDAWVQLDIQLRTYLRETTSGDVNEESLRTAVLEVDPDEVVLRFLDSQGLEPEDLAGDWKLTKLYARIPALQARLLRKLRLDAAAASALIEQSMHKADSRKDVSFGSPFVRGAHSTPLITRVAPAHTDASLSTATAGEHSIDTSDRILEDEEHPQRKRMRTDDHDTSMAARIWRGIWPWRNDDMTNQNANASATTRDDTSITRGDTSSNTSHVPTRTSFGGFGIGMGSSGVQSTAFSALGDAAQNQATAAAAKFARRRAARWESPQRARMRHNAQRGRARTTGDTSTLVVPSTFEESRKLWQERDYA